ncbi:hypothetical protein SAMN05428947_106223 [Mucilaginibacter sp. OK283]|nr:hypothetical protein SAMN05428947_106223 [Mucilaginibacter sp. OK283]
MAKALKLIAIILIFGILTILTQIGGVVYLLSFFTHAIIKKKFVNRYAIFVIKTTTFLVLYITCTFLIVPPLAKLLGRVPLPMTSTNSLQPLNILTCIFNRNYVRPQLKDVAFNAGRQMNERYPGTVINYLDASFPFINRFPLFPHLSHNDGKKLDFAFCYIDSKTSQSTNSTPSPIGYGVSEMPRPDEINTAALCSQQGYWQYSMVIKIVPQKNKANFLFDSMRTKKLVEILASEKSVGKIFIEPHLKARLNLTTSKIRFHGCRAVRHDDHIHVQLI